MYVCCQMICFAFMGITSDQVTEDLVDCVVLENFKVKVVEL